MKLDYLIYIGRFQPLHHGHLATVQKALELAEKVIIICGSARRAKSYELPWSVEEREQMLRACLSPEQQNRVYCVGVSDRMYNDQQWVTEVQNAVDKVIAVDTVNLASRPASYRIGTIGSKLGFDTYYLDFFPQWQRIEVEEVPGPNASAIRHAYFESPEAFEPFEALLPEPVRTCLLEFRRSSEYANLASEYRFVQQYKAAWRAAPYPPTFVTVDAVVIHSGHILLVRRRAQPGKGQWALPGGFVEQNERLKDAAIRELREETRLKVPVPVLAGSIRGSKVFDHPGRSLRGRTISHAFLFELVPTQEGLPRVKAADDADKVRWVPLSQFSRMESELFEDHFYMVNWFLGQI
ncbi:MULTISPECIES: bifunctional nicotinamide-nucleotide adenylyltransferase/Nudix hydroxylase [Leeia]|uniref:Bifunctional nicotinamide-nucleotide adenylyltransferase/Nudix hydroxylase n=1 Tax=Leeia aquatica TaxID=2725557 RepID=A0A847S8C4_9NEIS|nr:bifunctional nicotinamide-nucleotide adenylyltransferase/Nudix hydroxylase [Leeia aquatica]NLR73876.1 bifunctional nicotinamide-nucleotide adenylyltransferase/Nudix hydroxylase [Leeia aquatica]